MKYTEIIKKLRNDYVHGNQIISKDDLLKLYKKIYLNDNKKTFENMVSFLKKNETVIDYSKNSYLVLKKALYKFNKNEEILKIYKLISSYYKNVKTIVWDTNILNEFTQHYAINNYIVVETEKVAVELILTLLKEKEIKNYTIVTESMYNQNKDMFLNSEKIIIVKQLIVRAPLKRNEEGILEPTIEKIMVDIYKDKLYEQFQGKELQTIYKNILEKYSVNFKKLFSYAKCRVNLKEYKDFINQLDTSKIMKGE